MNESATAAQTYLFLSDAHLGGFSDEKNKQVEYGLISLVEYCQSHNIRIAILGDLFDYWMEYPTAIPELGKKLLDHFEEYNRQMGGTIYITGNHDNWTRDHFNKRGFEIISEQKFLDLDGNKIMLLHGDGLRNRDFNLPRPLLHRLLRHPTFIRYYQQLLPPEMGIFLMKYFSRFTRFTSLKKDTRKKLNNWAKNELKVTETDAIICGHDHIPRIKKFDFGTYVNLGNFHGDRTVALYNNGSFSLVVWNEQKRELKPFDTYKIDDI